MPRGNSPTRQLARGNCLCLAIARPAPAREFVRRLSIPDLRTMPRLKPGRRESRSPARRPFTTIATDASGTRLPPPRSDQVLATIPIRGMAWTVRPAHSDRARPALENRQSSGAAPALRRSRGRAALPRSRHPWPAAARTSASIRKPANLVHRARARTDQRSPGRDDAALRRRRRGLLTDLMPAYAGPVAARTHQLPTGEIEGRGYSLRHDDRLLHVDAFPDPARCVADRILRLFTNVAPDGALRKWHSANPLPLMPPLSPAGEAPTAGQRGGSTDDRTDQGHRSAYTTTSCSACTMLGPATARTRPTVPWLRPISLPGPPGCASPTRCSTPRWPAIARWSRPSICRWRRWPAGTGTAAGVGAACRASAGLSHRRHLTDRRSPSWPAIGGPRCCATSAAKTWLAGFHRP